MRLAPALAFLAASGALAGCAATAPRGPERVSVEAEGWAAEVPADVYGPRARALADAQKRAVEKAAGVSVAAVTRLDKGVAVRQRVWTQARGRIESWELLGDVLEDGFRKMRIRALVRLDPPAAAQEPPPADARLRVAAEGPAAAGLRRSLGARGFMLVERDEEYVVDARSSTSLARDPRLAPFVSGRSRLTVSVKDASGTVVWEAAREAAALDADPLLAAARATDAAGELAGRDAAEGLAEALWKR